MWHIPAAWKFWKWPEYLLSWIKGCFEIKKAAHEASEAKAKAKRAGLELGSIQLESRVADMKRKIETMIEQGQERYPGKNIEVAIAPGPDDDPEIFREAMRHRRQQRKRNLPSNDPPQFKPPGS